MEFLSGKSRINLADHALNYSYARSVNNFLIKIYDTITNRKRILIID